MESLTVPLSAPEVEVYKFERRRLKLVAFFVYVDLLIESCCVVLYVSCVHHHWKEHLKVSVAHLLLAVLSVILCEECTLCAVGYCVYIYCSISLERTVYNAFLSN